MLLVAAIDHTRLPSREDLLQRVLLDVGEKRDTWMRQRESVARASIAGVLLLQSLLTSQGCSMEDRLRYDENGKPYLERSRLPVSLSHSSTYAVCALDTEAGGVSIGVDVEEFTARDYASMERIAARWFTVDEQGALQADPTEECFLRIWTGKEAMAKRDGRGLAVLGACNTVDPPVGIRLTRSSIPNGVVSLCHPADRCPSDGVILMDPTDLK